MNDSLATKLATIFFSALGYFVLIAILILASINGWGEFGREPELFFDLEGEDNDIN